jgi:diguanylate cyclase (GGDEF)-like protein
MLRSIAMCEGWNQEMADSTTNAWGKSKFYEAIVLMAVGACAWSVGVEFGVFERATRYAVEHHLMNLVMLTNCMGMGFVVATVRKSFLLRRAITARMAAESIAEATARHDALTGLANRRLLQERLDAALATRNPVAPFAAMLIDLDRFKPINDLHGHAAGNAVLCAVADRLRRIVPPGGTVARLGGDEFVALLPCGLDYDGVADLAQNMIAAIRTPVPWNEGHVEVDATIGIAIANDDGLEGDALLHRADTAMYHGKRDGRGTFRFFLAGMDVAQKARAQLEAELRAAIARDEIMPYYQPTVSLPNRKLVGFEVLARWNHTTRGLVPPDEFIPIAEETGLIADLFYGLLRRACLDAGNWPPHLQMAINMSPRQLRDHQMPLRIAAILAETGFAPGRLETEVTETALINDLETARSILTSLQDLGVRIALDDFGTGYSSLYHLKELKFNKLKIDRSYVTTLMQGSECAKLVDAIIQLGSSLSLETTAEGIETDANLDWLSDQGCDFAQGYFFGSPMPKEAVEAFLQRNQALAQRQIMGVNIAA